MPANSSPPAATASTAPPPSALQDRVLMIGTSAPALTPASTPLEPSAFITTTDQLPWRTSHVSVWRPAPWAEATQKSRLAGGAGCPPPRCGR